MTRTLFLALAVALLVAECVAQFLLHNQELTNLACLLGLAVVAIRWAIGPQTADERDCPADCPECADLDEQR